MKGNLEKMVSKAETEKFSITSAQYGIRPNAKMVASLNKYNSSINSSLIILPMNGKCVAEDTLHSSLRNMPIVDTDAMINNSLKISNYKIRSQQILPLTGIRRFAAGDKSFIFASPKITLEYVANSNDKLPKAIMTTGAITEPNYNLRNRIGRIAQKDHKYGFVAVEKINNTIFNFRNVPVLRNGKFVDMGMLYDGDKTPVKAKTKAMVIGDLHPYDTNKAHEKCSLEQIRYFKPEKIMLHDTFNGKSISHHNIGHNLKLNEIYNLQGANLEAELKETLKSVKRYAREAAKYGGDIYIVASNHDEHLERYLDEGRFIGDKGNDLTGAELYIQALKGKHVLQAGLEYVGKVPKNVHFLNRDEDFKVLGYQLGNHGDLGSNGGRGSLKSIEEANAKSISGHGHSAAIRRDTIKVGTSTNMRIGYNRGYSNWTNTNAVLYDIGTCQLINTINKQWGK